MSARLLSSAPSMALIEDAIRDFYCGSAISLMPRGPDVWRVFRASDAVMLEGVRVVRKRGRYRFESVAA